MLLRAKAALLLPSQFASPLHKRKCNSSRRPCAACATAAAAGAWWCLLGNPKPWGVGPHRNIKAWQAPRDRCQRHPWGFAPLQHASNTPVGLRSLQGCTHENHSAHKQGAGWLASAGRACHPAKRSCPPHSLGQREGGCHQGQAQRRLVAAAQHRITAGAMLSTPSKCHPRRRAGRAG